jgi:kynurenine formamidase
MVSGSIINLKDIKKWKKKDTDARVILMSTITPKEQQAFANCKTAYAIWTKLAAQYFQNASANTHV